ncbi:MAG: low molecular weight protein-tyrosine-phosphatase [Bacteroidia bacterium]
MIKILYVCLGNICRSPLAEAVTNAELKKLGMEDEIVCQSAGTGNWHEGERPDPRTLEIGKTYKLEFNSLARVVTEDDFFEYDYIIVMDEDNMRNVRELQPEGATAEVFMMREFDPEGGTNVPDPYFGGAQGFENVYSILVRSVCHFLEYVMKKHVLTGNPSESRNG